MTSWGYCRVSTRSQSTRAQWDALVEAGIDPNQIYLDYAGGTRERRELKRLITRLQHGDEIVVTRLDRASRSSKELHELVAGLQEIGCSLRTLHEAVDTSGAFGKLMLHLLMALAEWDRERIAERSREGIVAARARGVKFGRSFKLSPVEMRACMAQLMDGQKPIDVARQYNVHPNTIYRLRRRWQEERGLK